MITGFEEYTHELNKYEEEKLLPVILLGLKTKIGVDKAITNKQMCAALQKKDLKINEARIRKIISFIRVNKLITNLVSTSKGYFIATKKEELHKYKESLAQRIAAIHSVYHSFTTT